MSRDLAVTNAHGRDLRQGGLHGGKQLALHLTVKPVAREGLVDVAADVLVEQQRVGKPVRVLAVAANRGVKVKADVAVDDAEGDGRRRAVLVAVDLLGVEVVDTLVLACVATEGEAASNLRERLHDVLAQVAVEQAGLGGGVVGELAGLGAHVDDLALLDDDHALAVGNGDDRAVGDDVVFSLGVGRAALRGSAL